MTFWQQHSSNPSLIQQLLSLPPGNALSLTASRTLVWGMTQDLFSGGLAGVELVLCMPKEGPHSGISQGIHGVR